MANLFASLVRSGNNLVTFQRALAAVQNNIANASTPGYARQRVSLEAEPFRLSEGLIGGVRAEDTQTARDVYAEQAVQYHSSRHGSVEEITTVLAQVEGIFGRDSDNGLRGALTRMFDSFADWSTAANDSRARQNVLDQAQATAQTFQLTAESLLRTSGDLHQQIAATVGQINNLASDLEHAATAMGLTDPPDAGAEAQFYARLEDLSQLADFTATRQADGTFTVLLGGQVPLLIGNQAHRLQTPAAVPPPASAPFPGAPPTTQLLDSEGNDVTALITGGRLGGLIELRNEALPSLIGGGEDQGRLNRLAQAFADTVNGILLSGEVTDPPSTEPVPLFVYDTAHPGRAAATLALNPDITPETLAAIQTTPSFVQNGIPLQLAALRDPSDPTLQLDGMSYGNFVIDTVAGIGTRYQRAASDQELENRLLVQAQNLRQQTSGVSLEQEAVMLLQFQRAYQATSQVVKVIDEMTQSVLGMLG